jgi:aromatic-amino-acid transaminase
MTTANCPCCNACKRLKKPLMAAPRQPRGYLPIDGIAAYDNAVKALVFGADAEPVTSRPRGHRASHWWHRWPENWRRFSAEAEPQRQGADQRPQLGKPPCAVHQRRLLKLKPTAYYDAAKRGVNFDGMLAEPEAPPCWHHRPLARLLPQPNRLRHHRRAVGPGD